MDDDEKVSELYRRLRYCPVCGNKLEAHPITQGASCYLHGDFITDWSDSNPNERRMIIIFHGMV